MVGSSKLGNFQSEVKLDGLERAVIKTGLRAKILNNFIY
jgi:hypothetical protein